MLIEVLQNKVVSM